MKKKEKKILIGLTVACIVSVLLMAGALVWYFIKLDNAKFVPPEPDPAAVQQEPPAIDGWREINHSEYNFGICGKVDSSEGKDITIWLYNDAENKDVFIKLRVKNESGYVIGETGLVAPGECLEKVQLERAVKKGEKLTYYVMAYDKDYHSLTPFPFAPQVS